MKLFRIPLAEGRIGSGKAATDHPATEFRALVMYDDLLYLFLAAL